METIEHILGICGEPHLNIYSILFIFFVIFVFAFSKTSRT